MVWDIFPGNFLGVILQESEGKYLKIQGGTLPLDISAWDCNPPEKVGEKKTALHQWIFQVPGKGGRDYITP